MNIQVKDFVGFSAEDNLKLVRSLLENRQPEDGGFDYGFETHGAMGFTVGIKLPYPIQVWQSNKRKSNKSPIVISIDRHQRIY